MNPFPTLASDDRGAIASDDLLEPVSRMYAAAVACHGPLDLTLEFYYTRILRAVEARLGPAADAAQRRHVVATLFGDDLYLTTACVAGSNAAWIRVLQLWHLDMARAASAICRDRTLVDDICDGIGTDLFLPGPRGTSRIGAYDGRCPLRFWLRRLVVNRCLNERARHFHRHRCTLDAAAHVPDPRPTPEGDLRRRRFLAGLESCLRVAFTLLDEQERRILYLRFHMRLGLAEIAAVCGIHVSSASRRVDAALGKVQRRITADTAAAARGRLSEAGTRIVVQLLPRDPQISPSRWSS